MRVLDKEGMKEKDKEQLLPSTFELTDTFISSRTSRDFGKVEQLLPSAFELTDTFISSRTSRDFGKVEHHIFEFPCGRFFLFFLFDAFNPFSH
jgi:hypothetical protein